MITDAKNELYSTLGEQKLLNDGTIRVTLAQADSNELHVVQVKDKVRISGNGGVTGSECGYVSGLYFSGKQFRVVRHSCNKQGCPICYKSWSKMQSHKSAGYLWAIRQEAPMRLFHCVWSPDSSHYQEDDFYALAIMKKLLLKHHVGKEDLGYSYTRHPYRKRCTKCAGLMLRHPTRCKECGNEDFFWKFEPHVHFVTNFEFDKTNQEWLKDLATFGCIFKNVSTASYKDWVKFGKRGKHKQYGFIATRDHLEATICYELGHAHFEEGKKKQAIVHCGLFSRRNWDVTETKSYKDVHDEDGNPFYRVKVKVSTSPSGKIVLFTKCEPVLRQGALAMDKIYLKEVVYEYKVKRKKKWNSFTGFVPKSNIAVIAQYSKNGLSLFEKERIFAQRDMYW